MLERLRSICRLITAVLLLAAGPGALADAPPDARLGLGVPLGHLPRFGINLGGRTVWGAEQLMHNVLRNPGLEPAQDGALVVVGRVDGQTVEDDVPWTARPPGFWRGARVEVLSGAAAGWQGGVVDNQRRGPDGPDRLVLTSAPIGLGHGDVLSLQGQTDPAPAPLWWIQGSVASVAAPRPGSPGTRSVRLLAAPGQSASLFHHLDSIGARAGKLLPVRGRWQLALWVRRGAGAARLRLSFGRQGRPAWLARSLTPSSDWQHLAIDFDALDDGPPGPLMLSITAEAGEVWIDDVALGPATAGPAGGFRDEVVQTLRALQPGYLRDWQGQLADTAENRLAGPFARRPTRYRPGEHERQFAYALPEFLALAAAVGARPWVVLPATTTPPEARTLGQALHRAWQQHGFDEIVVEHGNEHWNAVFRPAGIADPMVLAEVADRAFAALREGAGPQVPLHRVLGAQAAHPAGVTRIAGASRHTDAVAVAPYFHFRQNAADSTEAALERALHEPDDALRLALAGAAGQGKALDVYEVNFHTTAGDATSAQRDAVVTAPAAGAALMRRLMQSAALGVQRQAVYALAGYDTYVQGGRDLVQLFGVTRDLAGPAHWRATGQALAALNSVVGGPAHAALCQGPGCNEITALAFGAGARWALVNAAATALTVQWPCAADLQLTGSAGAVPGGRCVRGQAQAVLPARSWITAVPGRGGRDPDTLPPRSSGR